MHESRGHADRQCIQAVSASLGMASLERSTLERLDTAQKIRTVLQDRGRWEAKLGMTKIPSREVHETGEVRRSLRE